MSHVISYGNHWNYVGQTRSRKTVYAKVRSLRWNRGPEVTYSRLKVKRNGFRKWQRVTALCNGSGMYQVNNGYLKHARYGTFRRFEINRVRANRRVWRFRGGMVPVAFRGGHVH